MRPSSYARFAYSVHRVGDIRSLERKVIKGVAAGVATETSARHWVVAWQRGCVQPIENRWIGRASVLRGKRKVKAIFVDEYLACRKCEACMRSRSYMWAARARDEFDRAARTWMGTFTMSPAEHALLDLRISERTANRTLRPEELLRERTAEFGREVTTWLKRVRTAAYERTGVAGTLRYLLVAEVHDSEKTDEWMRGRPHYHMLLHEASVGAVISDKETYIKQDIVNGELVLRVFASDDAMVRKTWQFGFTKFELCKDSKTAFYLCKYLSKSMMWRVRPSIRYGRDAVGDGVVTSPAAAPLDGEKSPPFSERPGGSGEESVYAPSGRLAQPCEGPNGRSEER